MRRSLLYQIYPVYLVAMLAAFGLLAFATAHILRSAFYTEKEMELRTVAQLVNQALGEERNLSSLVLDAPLRITIIGADGVVHADTHVEAVSAENHARRPEFLQARETGSGSDTRTSVSTNENSLYVAVAAYDKQNEFAGVVRAAASVRYIDRRASEAFTAVLFAGLLIIVATGAFIVVVVRHIYKPLFLIQDAALRYASGELSYRIDVRAPEEIAAIARTLNGMATQLAGTIASITEQRNELEAILSSMVEGVVVVDQNHRISSINRAAAILFGVVNAEVKGKSVIEALRNAEIDQLVEQASGSSGSLESTLVMYGPVVRHVHVHATKLRNRSTGGVLLVMNDITKMKQLENIRRDFVANVSHELRTPITSILGFVETLRDGALDDPETAQRFTEIIHSHSVRLNLIIEDLLSLSRLESYDIAIPLEDCRVDTLLGKAVQMCEHEAERKGIQLSRSHTGAEYAQVNTALLEQALVNLINNAVKYSPTGSTVTISADSTPERLVVRVSDRGSGIPRRDLERVFERFYRVDRARSRDVGGTGLGLAIVKHIAIAHQGEVQVESVEGRGSTFTLSIPQTPLSED